MVSYIYVYIYIIFYGRCNLDVGKYTIHESYGVCWEDLFNASFFEEQKTPNLQGSALDGTSSTGRGAGGAAAAGAGGAAAGGAAAAGFFTKSSFKQWLFLVPLIGGR